MTEATGASRSVDTRGIWSWALYDFANSPFTTLIVTFIYSQYFVRVIASDPIRGTLLWSRGVTVTAVVVALASPFLGALADRGGFRKAFLVVSSAVCIVGSKRTVLNDRFNIRLTVKTAATLTGLVSGDQAVQ